MDIFCVCVHILRLVQVVSLDICEVKIVALACIQKISELPKGNRTHVSQVPVIVGLVVLPLDHRVSERQCDVN
jgi:hypothetical protein